MKLQELDTNLDQLDHKFAHLPERDEVAANAREAEKLDAEIATVQDDRDGVARDQKRIEDEVATVEAKAAEVKDKLYGGTVKAHKELLALQEDFDSLKRRQATLEDRVIELMETAEPIDARLAELAARRAELETVGQKATIALAEAESVVVAERAVVQAERDGAVAEVPDELVKEYERLRPQFGGIAVARLVGTNCNGCHLTLSAMALDSIRSLPPDALALCDECGRILVH